MGTFDLKLGFTFRILFLLATPSKTFFEILDATNSTVVSAKQIGELVANDPALSRTVLRVANVRQAGLGREVMDANRASLLLGATTIRHICLSHELVQAAQQLDIREKDKVALWEDCLRRGSAASLLAHRYGAVHPDMAFAIGFALEFGRLWFMSDETHSTHSYSRIRQMSGEQRIQAEIDTYGTSHQSVFLEITGEWKLPELMVDAISKHLDPPEEIRNKAVSPLATFIARWSNAAAEVFSAKKSETACTRLQEMLNEEAGLGPDEIEQFMDQVSLQTMNYANVFSLPLSAQPTLEKILDDAKTREDPSSMSKEELVNLVSNLQVEMDELEEEMQELRSQLLSMTQFDSLTGLPSRGHFMVSLRQEVARARRYERPLSLVILDMDEFTEFNAKHGQTAGDVSLQSASLILQKVVRDCDFLARSGGDEFAVVLPETDSAGGRLFAERVRACMESLKVDVDGKRLPVSACVIGINLNSMPLDSDHEVFYAAALRGVKKLRQRGPNRVSWVDPRAK